MRKKITFEKFEEMFNIKTCETFYVKNSPQMKWKDKWDNYPLNPTNY